MRVTNTKLGDVEKAFRAIPKSGVKDAVRGRFTRDKNVWTHVQGLAALPGHYLFTHSDKRRESGRVLVGTRAEKELVSWLAVPSFRFSSNDPFFFHPGGCQLIGECLVVACESQKKASVVAFVNLSDPAHPREIEELRIRRDDDTMAVGVTYFNRDGEDVWLVAAYQKGRVYFYESTGLVGPLGPFTFQYKADVDEQSHQAFILLTQTMKGADQVFAVGLNVGEAGSNVAILYRLDGSSLTQVGKPKCFDTKGAGLRWGSTIEIVSETKLVLHCTDHRFDDDVCTLNTFDPDTPLKQRVTGRVARKRTAKAKARPGRHTRRGTARRAEGRSR